MGPVCELFPVEGVGVEEALLVGPAVVVEGLEDVVEELEDVAEELEDVVEEPMSTPGGISGLSTKCRFGAVHEKAEWLILTTNGVRFVRVPTILKLVCAVSLCGIYYR